jgi:hypothetical protein
LPKSETGLLESEAACIFFSRARSDHANAAEHQLPEQPMRFARARVDVLLDGAATKSEDCQQDARRNAGLAPEPLPQTEISVALS